MDRLGGSATRRLFVASAFSRFDLSVNHRGVASKHIIVINQKRGALESQRLPFDPNSVEDPRERVSACYWELLRRNHEFQSVAERWLGDEQFRFSFSECEDYHNHLVHFPRCALDWMLAPSERLELARYQIKSEKWFHDERFNFGLVSAELTGDPLWFGVRPLADGISLSPLKAPVSLLRISQSWREAPSEFREEFGGSIHMAGIVEPLSERMRETADYLQWAAARIERGDRPDTIPEIAETLYSLGIVLANTSEFNHVFAIPNGRCSPGTLKQYLEAIKQHCRDAGQIEKRYCTQSSWLGTEEQWRYFLLAERHGFRPDNLKHMYALARIYSEALRQAKHENQAREHAKAHGFKGDAIPSKVISSRRSTVRRLVTAILGWVDDIYPASRWLKRTSPIQG